jgi:outer membrane protein TolC
VERQTTQLQSQRRVTSVFLVKALGGDWQRATGPVAQVSK